MFWAANAAAQQTSLADSLTNLLTSAREDTLKVLLLDELGWVLKSDDPDQARKYLNQALALAQRLDYKTGIGKAWNDLGVLENIHSNYEAAAAAFQKALEIRQQIGDQKGVASVYNNMATVMEGKGDYVAAISNYQKSLRIREATADSARMARLYYNMGDLHEKMGNYPEALDQILRFMIFAEKADDEEGLATGNNALGNIYYAMERPLEALPYYEKALALFRKLEMAWESANAMNNIANVKGDLAEVAFNNGDYTSAVPLFDSAIALQREVIRARDALQDENGLSEAFNNLGVIFKDRGSFFKSLGDLEKAAAAWAEAIALFNKSLKIRQEVGDKKGIVEVFNGLGDVYRRQKNYPKALFFTKDYLRLAEEIGDLNYVQSAYKDLSKIYEETGDYRNAFEYRKRYDELRYSRMDEKRVKDIERRQVLYGDQQKELEIERQQQRNALLDAQLKQREAEIRQAAILRNSLLGGALALVLFIGLLYNRNRIKTKANAELSEKNMIIEKERQRSDALLLNILPASTAEELKQAGKAKARYYPEVSVLFSDFKSFTTIAEKLSPEELVAELDECFRAFDEITVKYGVEKIKTIGDAYMCVSGLPIEKPTHADDLILAAREMLIFMENRRQNHPHSFEMRIGIHSGPVVAGIVGSKKFAYDIWGDTVNLAARMEQNSEPGRINISQATFELVKEKFPCTSRGKIAAKNKGEVAMYFVDLL